MLLLLGTIAIAISFASTCRASFSQNYSSINIQQSKISFTSDRPENCPPCFNCLLPAFSCGQYSSCNQYNGICSCPPGFGGDDCLSPVCGSLARGTDRPMRQGDYCECDDGWTGINCNVCKDDKACDALMPTKEGGVCYQNGEVVHENFQMCDVTNSKIVEILNGRRPQVTFTCNKDDKTCDFQFWVEHKESFYCGLENCTSKADNSYLQNSTSYECDKVRCSCIPGQMLCGENGSVDISDFLTNLIRGPATFSCQQARGQTSQCMFKEPEMNGLIQTMFGDDSIHIDCQSGECLYKTDVPGYERPVKKINTPLIAGVIATCSLFLMSVVIVVWYLARSKMAYGHIYLDESDDENSKLMVDHKPASLYFDNVSYKLGGKRILTGIKGIAHPGEILAVMGASGAGKTTFLDIIARKNKRGIVEGNFYVNGEKVNDSDYQSFTGFVDQEDAMLSTLTVHETIMNSALLRLPRDMGISAKEQRVFEVEKQLGIFSIRDTLIGSEEGKGRGISGGEKRRVGIACELVTSPSILFLDEPTSGLDAYNAFNVVECLVTLAKTYKRTVIFTIHQPRSNIVALFDRLLLLAKGKTVYSGEFSRCQQFFDDLGFSCPPGFNIADYLVDLTMHITKQSPFPQSMATEIEPEAISSPTPSSTKAIKSIASVSGTSINESFIGSLGDTSLRSQGKQKDTVKLRQERELFGRRKPGLSMQIEENLETQPIRLSRQNPNPQNHSALEDLEPLLASSFDKTEFESLISAFEESEISKDIDHEIETSISNARNLNDAADVSSHNSRLGNETINVGALGRGYARIGYIRQFIILSERTWKNLYRNPMLMLMHYAIAILLAVLSGFLFYGLTDDIPGFQNRLGLFFFILALFGFSTLSSLNVFSTERIIFIRERANGYYSPVTYFAAKVLFDLIPLRIIPPIIMGSIVYPMTGLVPDANHFFKFLLVLVLFNLAACGICLFIGITCKDSGVANLVGSLVMLFSLLFAGLLLNHDAIPKSALWLQSLSIFHYGFESLIVNEVTYLTLTDHKYGLDITVPGAVILSSFGFNTQALWSDVFKLGLFAASFIILAFMAMHFMLIERR
ncbi:BgTH12-03827 [Blumeria graminis f. sp. triticale]|uniref:BgtASP-20508 n=3 Tax=Blumeria graminis TaxID=34373 RepID=A0A9X9PRC3_BLUGR|nr:hypothetical protein BGT96224_ASP20508 [Blumeria graminis f. sp. tritici 96224]CAD6499719.1 BgTH12-03827 [Blumeria graminis f. sp. triticale]VCU39886.1 BgtASP-20508 [Blumeria graminis f. sp. tritici]